MGVVQHARLRFIGHVIHQIVIVWDHLFVLLVVLMV